MKREDQTVIQCKQPIKLEKPLQCLRCSLIKSSVKKKIVLPFSKLKSWLKTQRKHRDRGGGGAGRAAAPPLFCAPAPTFCAKKKNN